MTRTYKPIRHFGRTCEACGAPIRPEARITARFCSKLCQGRVHMRRFIATAEGRAARKAHWKAKPPVARMLAGARRRARALGLACTITAADIIIPRTCPVLGIPLKHNMGRRGPKDASPSLDRIIPALGYVPGNARVISQRANLLKSNATIAEMEAVLADMKRHLAAPQPRKMTQA